MSEFAPGRNPRTLENLVSIAPGTNINPLNIGKDRALGRKVFETVGDIEIPTDSKAFKELTKKYPELFPKGAKSKFRLRHILVMRLYWEALYSKNPVPAIKEILDREMGKAVQPIEAKIDISSLEKLTEDELIEQLRSTAEFTESIGIQDLADPSAPGPTGTD